MKRFIIFLAIVALAFLVGCTMTGKVTYLDRQGVVHVTETPTEDCVLYKIMGDTTGYRFGLFITNDFALRSEIYTAQEALTELDNMDAAIDEPMATVGSVITAIMLSAGKAAKVGAPELFIIAEGVAEFKDDITPIDDCTWYRLRLYIGKQRTLTRMYL